MNMIKLGYKEGSFQGSLMLANVWILHYQTDDLADDLTVAPINYGRTEGNIRK
jgi:hypothetical protein